jgi:hypothetical protein
MKAFFIFESFRCSMQLPGNQEEAGKEGEKYGRFHKKSRDQDQPTLGIEPSHFGASRSPLIVRVDPNLVRVA